MAEFRCTICPPHRGENESRSRDRRYTPDGQMVRRKPKETK